MLRVPLGKQGVPMKQGTAREQKRSPLSEALGQLRSALFGTALFSVAINLLMLTGPVFMLQIYDRVLASRSIPTLAALALLAAALYLFLGAFEFIRARMLSRCGYRFDEILGSKLFRFWLVSGVTPLSQSIRPLQELTVLRQFFSSPGFAGMFDLPWVPFYLAIVFIIHPWLGFLAFGGALLVAALAVGNELLSRRPLQRALEYEYAESVMNEAAHRNAGTLMSMGMVGNVIRSWQDTHATSASASQTGTERSEIFTASSKAIRLLLQSAILALGAWLAIYQEITPGMIVAASIIAGRALAPIDLVIGQWKGVLRARSAYQKLAETVPMETDGVSMEMPDPVGELSVEGVTVFAPGNGATNPGERRPILRQISFELKPGDALGVIGPSAAGKSTLARVLANIWVPDSGAVRLDGARLEHWDVEQLGRRVGYLPQDVALFPGTVRDNIGRFELEISDEEIIEAAQMAGVHELILRLPEGYATRIGAGVQTPLSGGQVQRIGLARALFKTPKLVILDEPNSNLDAAGDKALTEAITKLRELGSTVVVMAHRPSAIAAVNKVLMLDNGATMAFGDKNEVLGKVARIA